MTKSLKFPSCIRYGINAHCPKSIMASVYKLHVPYERPTKYRASHILPHTVSASKLYKFLHNSSTASYSLIQFYLVYEDIVYCACLKRASPYTDKVCQCNWIPYMRTDPYTPIVNSFHYSPDRLVSPVESATWTSTDIVYDG